MEQDDSTAGGGAADHPWWKGAHFLILAGVLLLMVGNPLLSLAPWSRRLSQIALYLLLGASYFGAVKGFHLLRLVIGLVLLKVVLEVLIPYAPSGLAAPAHVPGALLLGIVIVRMLQFLLQARRITPDILFASVSTYLFLGLLAAQVFLFLEAASPGSLGLGVFPQDPGDGPGGPSYVAFLYYGFVTLTTLGFGDITPKTPPAMILTVLVAVAGQMYVAIVVARLVSLQLAAAARKDP